jgi:iron complex transport system ATP-binding protein
VPYRGGYSAFVRQRAERELTLRRAVEKQQAFIARQEDYIRRNIAGQNTAQAKGRRKLLARLPRLSPPPGDAGAMYLRLEIGERGGDRVVQTDRLAVAIGGRTLITGATVRAMRGDVIALVGPNGAGKSSLLKALCGLVPHTGAVTWRGATLTRAARARTIAYLPQTPPVHWALTAHDVVALGRLPHRSHGTALKAADLAAVATAMRQTDTAAFAARSVDRLSVGERARVLLARALAVDAPVLLADEPVATLDPHHQLRVMATLRQHAAHGRLVVTVLHDLGLAARFCTRVLLMSGGRIVADGPPSAALAAETIRTHYRVEPFITRHEDEDLIAPWRPLAE